MPVLHISLIVAVADNGVIGRNGDLPWHVPADLKHFKTVTMGKPLIMGRKTFESIGKPLPGRTMIIITRDSSYQAEGITVSDNWDGAIAAARATLGNADDSEVMVIGGAEIYALAFPHADRLYLTEIHETIEGDTVFPEFDRTQWRETAREDHESEGSNGPAFSFVSLERKS